MKNFIAVTLVCILLLAMLSGCDRKIDTSSPEETQQPGSFSPETTAVASGGLVHALDETQEASAEVPEIENQEVAVDAPETQADTEETQPGVSDQPVAQDSAATQQPEAEPAVITTPEPVVQPFATATPQPNTAITSYTEVIGTGLGFKFSYPSGWNNIPGRSTVCYVQPLENGTVYPARVAVTMKRLPHKCSAAEAQEELVSYLKNLMTQYDASTFKVDKQLDTETRFMGNKAMSTTYLAYDGDQEIQGYVIMTYFERYLFCYHFLCAYEDYTAFEPAMRHMRDSVQADQQQISES